MSTTDFEPDQDLTAAEAPYGFTFNDDSLDPVQVDRFPERSDEAVEGLLWLGYLTEEVDLFGHRFVIRTLTRGDKLIVTLVVKEWEDTLGAADAYETAMVAASLLSVDGQPLAELSRAQDRNTVIRRGFELVKGWYDPTVAALFEKVMALNQRQSFAFQALQGK